MELITHLSGFFANYWWATLIPVGLVAAAVVLRGETSRIAGLVVVLSVTAAVLNSDNAMLSRLTSAARTALIQLVNVFR